MISQNNLYPSDASSFNDRPLSKRILLVEDEPLWQMLISKTVKSIDRNIGVRCVRSVHQAQEILDADSRYDMIISDFRLNGDDTGMDLWQKCRRDYRPIPFMVVTGAKKEKLMDLVEDKKNFPHFLEKSFQIDQLRQAIRLHLHSSSEQKIGRARKPKYALGLFILSLLTPLQIFFNEPKQALIPFDSPQPKRQAFTASHQSSEPQVFQLSQIITDSLKTQIAQIAKRQDRWLGK